MKKSVFFVFLIVLGTVGVIGQTGRPCAEYDQNRNISGMREILMKDGVFYQNLRTSYAEVVNYGVGKNIITPSKYGMEDILDKTILLDVNFVVPSDYLNGVRFGDEIKFTTLTGQPSDKWAAFRYMGVDYIYAKVSCMNPQKPKKQGVFVEEKTDTYVESAFVTNRSNWSYQEPKVQKEDLCIPTVKEEKYNEWKWIALGAGVLLLGGGIYLATLNNDIHYHYYPRDKKPDPKPEPEPEPEEEGGPGGTPPTTGKKSTSVTQSTSVAMPVVIPMMSLKSFNFSGQQKTFVIGLTVRCNLSGK